MDFATTSHCNIPSYTRPSSVFPSYHRHRRHLRLLRILFIYEQQTQCVWFWCALTLFTIINRKSNQNITSNNVLPCVAAAAAVPIALCVLLIVCISLINHRVFIHSCVHSVECFFVFAWYFKVAFSFLIKIAWVAFKFHMKDSQFLLNTARSLFIVDLYRPDICSHVFFVE